MSVTKLARLVYKFYLGAKVKVTSPGAPHQAAEGKEGIGPGRPPASSEGN